jgi:two-component system sensor histidine kinase KdpD
VAFPQRTLEALSTLIAAAIDRAHAIELVGKSEAARERERLKSVLLDAIAHDFKTPLTSIKAAATSLLDDLSFNKRQRGDLLEVIDEECDRINQVIGEAIEMARLDSGNVTLQLLSHPVDELISSALEDCKSVRNTRAIPTEIHPKTARVVCDLFCILRPGNRLRLPLKRRKVTSTFMSPTLGLESMKWTSPRFLTNSTGAKGNGTGCAALEWV